MKHENNIDNYFSRVKQNPPLMDIEQVRKVITEANTKVETEVKIQKAHRNLLKFTIMTTIFAVILSAVLFWTGEDKEYQVSGIKYQDERPQVASSIKAQETRSLNDDENLTDIKNTESNNDNKLLAMANLNENSSGLASNQPNDAVGYSAKSAQSAQQNGQQSLGFDPDTIKPIDGGRFILKLSDEELKKIGFEINDTLVSFQKCVNGRQFIYSFRSVLNGPGNNRTTSQAFLQVSSTDNKCPSPNEIKPSCQTNNFFSELRIVDYFENEDFNLVNDTLLPVIVSRSVINPDVMDDILWFAPSDQLLKILSKKHQQVIDEFLKYKKAKQAFPKTDLIRYQPPPLIDESKILVLSTEELAKIGFQFCADSTIFKGRKSDVMVEVIKKINGSKTIYSTTEGGMNPGEDGCLAVIVTRQDGSPYMTFGKLIQFLFPNNTQYGSQFPLLLPVLIKSKNSLFEEDVIFWFYPTDAFFKALPERISNELRKEYNYITAEDKSALEKPECKYFDECKNTLKVLSFKVYPNPANANANVSFTLPEAITGRITLVDLAGRERQVLMPQASYAKGQHNIPVDLSNIPEGMYLLTLYTSKGVQTQRVIVAR
jgi:hypothetical protein